MPAILRPFRTEDSAAVLALNLASEQFLSPLDEPRLQRLVRASALLWVAEQDQHISAFLLGFTADADYDSINYQWFNQRFKGFFYIDRIVVDDRQRGQGLGSLFYRAVTDWARQQALHWLAAEIDIAPANPRSLHFHQQRGFVPLATQSTGRKQVSLQVKSLEQE